MGEHPFDGEIILNKNKNKNKDGSLYALGVGCGWILSMLRDPLSLESYEAPGLKNY